MMRDGLHTRVTIRAVGQHAGWTCGICGHAIDPRVPHTAGDGPSVDHILPRCLGGSDDPANLRLAHRRCNSARPSRLTRVQRQQLRDLGRIEAA
jgi:5-methylcytosine-specific restriction endonuclease McrA